MCTRLDWCTRAPNRHAGDSGWVLELELGQFVQCYACHAAHRHVWAWDQRCGSHALQLQAEHQLGSPTPRQKLWRVAEAPTSSCCRKLVRPRRRLLQAGCTAVRWLTCLAACPRHKQAITQPLPAVPGGVGRRRTLGPQLLSRLVAALHTHALVPLAHQLYAWHLLAVALQDPLHLHSCQACSGTGQESCL